MFKTLKNKKNLKLSLFLITMLFCIFHTDLKAEALFFESEEMSWVSSANTINLKDRVLIHNKDIKIEADSVSIEIFSPEDSSQKEDKNLFAEENLKSIKAHGKPLNISLPQLKIKGLYALYKNHGEDTKDLYVEGDDKNPAFLHYKPASEKEVEENLKEIRAYSLRQKWQTRTKSLVLEEKVELQDEKMTVKAELVTLYYEEDKEGKLDIKEITALGELKIVHAEGEISGEKADFKAKDKLIVITGNPANINHNGQNLKGETIRIHTESGQMEISGKISGTLMQKEALPSLMPF